MAKKRLAIFASGSGSNAEAIIRHFKNHDGIEVSLILSNKVKAFVHERAKNLGVKSASFSRDEFYHSDLVQTTLKNEKIDFIILAGFMWLVPQYLVTNYPDKIFNIHPSLLPKYGGKGMYGHHVHQAVIDADETESGITIHLVNEEYDKGEILCQEKLEVVKGDTADTLAGRIHSLEHKFYPLTIEKHILEN